jgi:MFS family permease
MVFLVEHAPEGRRGLMGALISCGAAGGILIGSAVGAAFAAGLSAASLEAWGWRIPFVIGAVAALGGLYLRRNLPESQTFEKHRASGGRSGVPELKARIANTIAFVESIPQGSLEGSEDREVVMKMRAGEVKYAGLQYLLGHAYPNFYFHVTTAYNILRANGVEIGKRDYIGNP